MPWCFQQAPNNAIFLDLNIVLKKLLSERMVWQWLIVRNTVTIFDYMHIFNFLFNILISPFLTSVLLLFSTEDMSRNDT